MSSRVRRTVLFAGGGTGGHLFPAVSIADRIRELAGEAMTVDISFVGTRRGLEYRLGESLGYPLHLINIRGFVRSFTMSNLLLPFIIVGALIASWRLLRRLSPDLIVGSGGYVCWPVLKIAAMQKIPSVLQEQNSFPGITTRQAAASASRIYLGFAEAKQHLHTRATIMITGNPVRSAISRGARGRGLKAYGLDSRKKTILILGGSQGARAINRAVIGSLQRCRLPDNIQLLWQTGKRDYTEVAMQMGSKVTGCSLFPFAEQMETVYAVADLAIARAGALTLAELAACNTGALLVPYPFAAGDHQRKNAQAVVKAGGAIMVDEKELRDMDLLGRAIGLIESEQHLQMSEALKRSNEGRPPAVDVIAEDILQLLQGAERTGTRSDNESQTGT